MRTIVVPAKWSSFHAAKEFTHGCQNKKRFQQRKAAETVPSASRPCAAVFNGLFLG